MHDGCVLNVPPPPLLCVTGEYTLNSEYKNCVTDPGAYYTVHAWMSEDGNEVICGAQLPSWQPWAKFDLDACDGWLFVNKTGVYDSTKTLTSKKVKSVYTTAQTLSCYTPLSADHPDLCEVAGACKGDGPAKDIKIYSKDGNIDHTVEPDETFTQNIDVEDYYTQVTLEGKTEGNTVVTMSFKHYDSGSKLTFNNRNCDEIPSVCEKYVSGVYCSSCSCDQQDCGVPITNSVTIAYDGM